MAAARIIVVTAGDSLYRELLEDLVCSLLDGDAPCGHAVGLLDVGLQRAEVERFAARGVIVVEPGWDIAVPEVVKQRGWFRAMTARPNLPKHFPGYDVYLWIDADAWVQDRAVIGELAAAAAAGRMAIVAETYAAEGVVFEAPGADGTPARFRVSEQAVREGLRQCYALFGPHAEQHAQGPIFNSGVFALRGDSPSWGWWSRYLAFGLQRGSNKLIEQQALSLAIIEGRIPHVLMPRRCNWNVGAELPILDAQAGRFLTPDGEAIAIMHLQELKQVAAQTLRDTDGRMVRLPITGRAFRRCVEQARVGGTLAGGGLHASGREFGPGRQAGKSD
jgi:hypothetical protein